MILNLKHYIAKENRGFYKKSLEFLALSTAEFAVGVTSTLMLRLANSISIRGLNLLIKKFSISNKIDEIGNELELQVEQKERELHDLHSRSSASPGRDEVGNEQKNQDARANIIGIEGISAMEALDDKDSAANHHWEG